ncbi:caspase recruitment domain-containing protein 19 isoform X2 [Equus asinus]|uniref:caspase recruitment domain-containing protein 19 isoform X2 n=1 Tax=Equus asinus TaxID=9793 RepID=UPI0038F758CA
MTEQTYCDRLVQDTPFLTGPGRLSEQQVDRIILQLNRYYPQILSNKDAEKVPRGGPEAALLPPPFWAGESRRQDSSEVEACLLGVPLDPEHQLSEPQCLHMSSGGAGGNHRRQHMTARHKPGRRSRGSSGAPRRPCVCGSATSWATCSGAASGTARSFTAPCTSTPSPCTAVCPAGTPCRTQIAQS